jgi:hypothetical protein
MKESKIEEKLRISISSLGGWAIKLIGIRGIPDRLVILDGRVYFVETKASKGVVSRVQRFVHRKLFKMGFKVYILWSIEHVENFVNDITL